MAFAWREKKQPDVKYWWIIPLLSGKNLVGKVLSTNDGIVIESLIGGLPLDDGTTTNRFFAHSNEVPPELELKPDHYVLFQWKDPGTRRERRHGLGDPIPTIIRSISKVVAEEYVEDLNEELCTELARRLEDEIAELKSERLKISRAIRLGVEEGVIEKTKELAKQEREQAEKERKLHEKDIRLSQRESELKRDRQDLVQKVKKLQNDENRLREELKVEQAQIENEFEKLRQFYDANIRPHSDLFALRRPKPRADKGIQWVDPKKLGEDWFDMLGAELNLQRDLAMCFLLASLASNAAGSLVLLSGPVGIGKTKTIRVASRLLGGYSKVVPVRPGWLDSSDLLGFYDPLQDNYAPSPFVNSLCEANQQIERPFFLALDELNLARIENYGADLLSEFEYSRGETENSRDGEQSGLQLYAKRIEQRLLEEKRILQEMENKGVEQILRLKELENLLGSTLQIPENVILLGTLNADETTYDLSPKVIDRSYVLAFPIADLDSNWNAGDPHQAAHLNLDDLQQYVRDYKLEDAEVKNWSHIVRWNEKYLPHIGFPLGYRAERDYRVFMAVARMLGTNLNDAFGYFVFMKILPRIKIIKSHGGQSEKTDRLKELIEVMTKAHGPVLCQSAQAIIEWLKEQIDDDSRPIVTYWR